MEKRNQRRKLPWCSDTGVITQNYKVPDVISTKIQLLTSILKKNPHSYFICKRTCHPSFFFPNLMKLHVLISVKSTCGCAYMCVNVHHPSVCPVMMAVIMRTNPTISTLLLNGRGSFTPSRWREKGENGEGKRGQWELRKQRKQKNVHPLWM